MYIYNVMMLGIKKSTIVQQKISYYSVTFIDNKINSDVVIAEMCAQLILQALTNRMQYLPKSLAYMMTGNMHFFKQC